MKFQVIKSGMDGIAGGSGQLSIEEATREICNYKGWDSIEELRERIIAWGQNARPGDVFTTTYSVIVARSPYGYEPDGICAECGSDDLDWGEIQCVEDGGLEQLGGCNGCGRRWIDVFGLMERRELAPNIPIPREARP